jgi:multicomponent Na+:H+ antiporter subunit C
VTALLLALAYRSWLLTRDDEVSDDIEDRLVARRAEAEEGADVSEVDAGQGGEAAS